MSLNIKNEETHRLVRELAERTGESMTEAVSVAVRERLQRVEDSDAADRRHRTDALLRIGRDVANRMPPATQIADPGTLLYDDAGLPR